MVQSCRNVVKRVRNYMKGGAQPYGKCAEKCMKNNRRCILNMVSIAVVLSLLLTVVPAMAQTAGAPDYASEIESLFNYFVELGFNPDWEMFLALQELDLLQEQYSAEDIGINLTDFMDARPSFYGSRILALIALGEDPFDYHGHNLFDEMQDLAENHNYGTIYDQVYALTALRAGGIAVPDAALEMLINAQREDGGYGIQQSDPDSTAMVLTFLANYREKEAVNAVVEKGLAFLHDQQLPSGGFVSYGHENSNSIAKVISALAALGEDPQDAKWQKDGNTMLDALKKFRTDNGGVAWIVEDKMQENNFALKQVMMAYRDLAMGDSIFNVLRAPQVVYVRIEGAKEQLANETVNLSWQEEKDLLVVEALRAAIDQTELTVDIKESAYGPYLNAVGDEAAGAFGGYDGWLYLINGQGGWGIGSDRVHYGDEIVFYYGDFAPGTLIPLVEIRPLKPIANAKITVRLFARYNEYDANFNPTEVEVPVEGAKFTVNGVDYFSNSEGVVEIPKLPKGDYAYKISKECEDKPPALLRTHGALEVIERTAYQDEQDIASWAKGVVYLAQDRNLMLGKDNLFRPKENLTRAEAIGVLHRLTSFGPKIGDNPFKDVPKDHEYYQAIVDAYANGLIAGVSATEFNPEGQITRQEFATMIQNVFRFSVAGKSEFKDSVKIASWAKHSVDAVSGKGIIVGSYNNFMPRQNVTREQAAAIFVRLAGIVEAS